MNLLDEPVDQTGNEREELIAKWKDKPLEELLKAKVDSDLYVRTLEKQKDELRKDYLSQREELLAKAKFEELIDRFEKAPKDLQVANTQANEVESPKYDPKEIESLVLNKINETKLIEKQTENFNKVQSKLQERYGSNYASMLKEQQATLGLSTEDVNNLAMKSPEAFFRLMGLDQQRQDSFQSPPKTSQRNDVFSPRGAPKRDWAFYQEMKKANPKLYLDPKIAVQMHNDAVALGADFGMPTD